MEKDSDEKLMSRYRDGDMAAFDLLYERYRGPLYRYLLRQCGESKTEELYQDVWMRVIKAAHQWRDSGSFRAWLYRVAHNRLIDHWRSSRATEIVSEDDVVALDKTWPDALTLIRDCIERLFRLLEGLSEAQRSAFLLKEESGLSLEQIAEVTGAGRETVKSRLRYALRRLRKGLEGCDE